MGCPLPQACVAGLGAGDGRAPRPVPRGRAAEPPLPLSALGTPGADRAGIPPCRPPPAFRSRPRGRRGYPSATVATDPPVRIGGRPLPAADPSGRPPENPTHDGQPPEIRCRDLCFASEPVTRCCAGQEPHDRSGPAGCQAAAAARREQKFNLFFSNLYGYHREKPGPLPEPRAAAGRSREAPGQPQDVGFDADHRPATRAAAKSAARHRGEPRRRRDPRRAGPPAAAVPNPL